MNDTHEQPVEPERDVELFIDFANTLNERASDGPRDDVADFASLAAWLRRRGLLQTVPRDGRDAERGMAAFRELRAAIRSIAARLAHDGTPGDDAVARLNGALRDGLHYHELRYARDRHDGDPRFTVVQVGNELDQARSSIAGSLAHFLAEHEPDRLRVCASHDCDWLFVDTSPGGRRRWCDMRSCGNRAKVARHRARTRERSEAGSGVAESG